jgi:hypothetical protein
MTEVLVLSHGSCLRAQLRKAQKVVAAVPVALSGMRASAGKPTEVDAAAAAGATAVTAAAAAAVLPAKAAAAAGQGAGAAAAEGGEAATANVQQLLQKIPSEFRRAELQSFLEAWPHTAHLNGAGAKTALMLEAPASGMTAKLLPWLAGRMWHACCWLPRLNPGRREGARCCRCPCPRAATRRPCTMQPCCSSASH